MKLSIIIPVYNKKRYLEALFDQILVQTFADFECLLIDDGSTDGSGAVCDEFAAKDPRFRVFHIPNGGVSHARNVGLDAARGEYITFIDSDDGIRPGYLENLVACMEKSCADLVISGHEKVDADGKLLSTVVPQTVGMLPFAALLPDFAQVQHQSGIYGYCVAKVFSRVGVQNIRFDEGLKLAEDFDFFLNLYEHVETVYLDDRTDYLYLQDAENSTGRTDDEKIDYLAQVRINLHLREMLRKRGAWEGENRHIVEGRLSDYSFFVLFHTPLSRYRERFETLYRLSNAEQIMLTDGTLLRRWLFFCLRYHQYHAAKFTMTLYRFARNLRR